MKSRSALVSSLLATALSFALWAVAPAADAGTTGPANVCQTEGPVTVCNQNGFGLVFTVSYSGSLVDGMQVGRCRPDNAALTNLVMGVSVNGGPFATQMVVVNCHNITLVGSGFQGQGYRGNRVYLYFYNSRGQYDSRYGQNYLFQF